jgi:hypothetical protein
MSALTGRPVNVPVDGEAYEQFLKDMHAKYAGRKTVTGKGDAKIDMGASFR